MRKVDLVIGVLGAVAILATVLGIVFYDEVSGTRDLEFPERAVALEGEMERVDDTFRFTFDLPENATAAEMTLEMVFSGQAVQGGSATVQVEVTGPDGSTESFTESMTIPPGSASQRATFDLRHRWAEPPEPTQGDPSTYSDVLVWADPLVVTISVTPPSEAALPVTTYDFQPSVDAEALAYHVQAEQPDPQVR